MDACHFLFIVPPSAYRYILKGSTNLAVVLQRKVKGETSNSLGFSTCGDFQVLNHTGETLVFQSRVLSLGVLADDHKVDVVVASGDTRKRLAEHNRGVNVQLLTHSNIPGDMALDRGVEDT